MVDEKYTPEQAKKILTKMKIKNVIFKIFVVIGSIAAFLLLAGFVLNLMSFKIERNISGIMWSYDDNELIEKVTVKVKGKYVVADGCFKGTVQVLSDSSGELLYSYENVIYHYRTFFEKVRIYDVSRADSVYPHAPIVYPDTNIGKQVGDYLSMDISGKHISVLPEPTEDQRIYIAAPASGIEDALEMLDKKLPLDPNRDVWSEGGPVITYLGNGATHFSY